VPFKPKAAHEEAVRLLEESNVVMVAPTSYGKSKGVPYMQDRLKLPRSVHSMPLRSLVISQYNFLLREYGEACHASGLQLEGKCPYFGGKRVVSTVDYLSLNLLRLPPAELGWALKYSYGHYEYPRANLFSSLVVFDEAHLLSEPWSGGESAGRDFLHASLEALGALSQGLRFKVLVATATLPEVELKKIVKKMKPKAEVVAVCKGCYGGLRNIKRVNDFSSDVRWETEAEGVTLLNYLQSELKRVEDEASSGKVLIVANTVKEAIKAAELLRPYFGSDLVLVHGRLSEEDKKNSVNKIEKAKVVVSTQVIEAGVDVDATWLITEAAPVSSLAQRAGRLCRSRDCDVAKVTVLAPSKGDPYGDASEKAFKTVKEVAEGGGIEWRELDDTQSGKTFLSLINALESNFKPYQTKSTITKIITTPLPNIKGIKELLDELCSFVRDSALIELRAGEERLEVSLSWLAGALKRGLEVSGVKAVKFGGEEPLSEGDVSNFLKRLVKAKNSPKASCRAYSTLLEKYGALSLAVEVPADEYRKGWGMRVDLR